MIRVYTASKLKCVLMWRELDQKNPHVHFHARWLKHNLIGTPDTEEHAQRFWIEDEEDVRTADALMIYAEKDDHLRGALVEAGMALSLSIPVYTVGSHPDYGTWQHHPGVVRCSSMDEAMKKLLIQDRRAVRKKI